MSEKFNSEIAVIGIDIGKNSFHIVGQDRRGSIVLRARASLRNQHQGRSIMGSEDEVGNLSGGLAVRRAAGPSGHANSPHPSSREGHHSTARWSSSFLLSGLILPPHAAAACLVHRNSEPSTQMRCMITANRRASATIAFFSPRRLAICIAQTLSQDHFAERTSRIWAAS